MNCIFQSRNWLLLPTDGKNNSLLIILTDQGIHRVYSEPYTKHTQHTVCYTVCFHIFVCFNKKKAAMKCVTCLIPDIVLNNRCRRRGKKN